MLLLGWGRDRYFGGDHYFWGLIEGQKIMLLSGGLLLSEFYGMFMD